MKYEIHVEKILSRFIKILKSAQNVIVNLYYEIQEIYLKF